MENASKALLIAGAMLLMILMLTFAVFIVNRIGRQTSELYEEITESEITAFNQQFYKFETDNKKNLRIQDVVSIINLAKNNNERPKFQVTIKVKLNGKEIQNLSESEIIEMLKESNNNDKEDEIRFSCKVTVPQKSKFVETIEIN